MAKTHNITVAEIREAFDYDPETGEITWRGFRANGKGGPGKIAGGPDDKGYWRVRLNRVALRHSHIAWAIMTGAWPKDQIDHIDRDKANNCFSNLREASNAQNCQNRKKRSDNASGCPGVDRHHGRWSARIQVNGKRIFLGAFAHKDEAIKTYIEAKSKHHTFQPVL